MTGFVERLQLRAWLDDSGAALAAAREAADDGDPSWRQWLADYACGRAVIVRLQFLARCTDEHGHELVAECVTPGEWVEWSPHIPDVEAQLQELARSDAGSLARELQAAGIDVRAGQLADMAIRVELDTALHERLVALRACASRPHHAP